MLYPQCSLPLTGFLRPCLPLASGQHAKKAHSHLRVHAQVLLMTAQWKAYAQAMSAPTPLSSTFSVRHLHRKGNRVPRWTALHHLHEPLLSEQRRLKNKPALPTHPTVRWAVGTWPGSAV